MGRLTSLEEDLTTEEISLLKSALLCYKDCPTCQKEYPRTHKAVVRYVLPKIRRAALRKFKELTSFEDQIRFIHNEEEVI